MFQPQTLQFASGHGRRRNDAAQVVAALGREQAVQFGPNGGAAVGCSRPLSLALCRRRCPMGLLSKIFGAGAKPCWACSPRPPMVAIVYMTRADGLGYRNFGLGGLFGVDAGLSLAAAVPLLLLVRSA